MNTNEYNEISENLGQLAIIEAERIASVVDKKFINLTKPTTTKHILINSIERIQYKLKAMLMMSSRHSEMLTKEYISDTICKDLHVLAAIIYACNSEKELDTKNEKAVTTVVDMHDMFHEELMNVVVAILNDTAQ